MELLPLIILAIALGIGCFVATEFANIADEKGFDRRRYWHFCFWLGPVGYLMVVALPDRNQRELVKAIESIKVAPAESKPTISSTKPVTNYLPEL